MVMKTQELGGLATYAEAGGLCFKNTEDLGCERMAQAASCLG